MIMYDLCLMCTNHDFLDKVYLPPALEDFVSTNHKSPPGPPEKKAPSKSLF